MTSDCSELGTSAGYACPGMEETARVSASLLKIWQDLLHITEIEPGDDFFELGGDSLAAIRMLERIGREFGDELLEPDVIYTASSFGELVTAIASALASDKVRHASHS